MWEPLKIKYFIACRGAMRRYRLQISIFRGSHVKYDFGAKRFVEIAKKGLSAEQIHELTEITSTRIGSILKTRQ
jgi:hypothetical protein